MEPLSTSNSQGRTFKGQHPTPKGWVLSRGVALAVVLALSVSACAVRAPYKAPTVAPTTMKNADATLVVEQAFDPRWWGQFDDPVLDELVSRALTANHDVRIAVARLDQARAIFDDVRLDQYPTVTAGGSLDRRSEQVPGLSEKPLTISSYRLGFDAFWEIDVFGRIRNQVRSAAATAESFQANVDDVRVIVAAEVARNYFELRGLQQRLAVAERSLSNQQETLRLTQVRRDAGIEGQFTFSFSAGFTQFADRPADGWPPPMERAPTDSEFRYAPAAWTAPDGRPRLVGSPDDLIGDLGLLAAAGVDHVTLRFGTTDPAPMERFARDVMPALT